MPIVGINVPTYQNQPTIKYRRRKPKTITKAVITSSSPAEIIAGIYKAGQSRLSL